MEFGLLNILELIGALGFFIYGMKEMSEGIQKVAGSKMREILRVMTSNRFLGVFTGFLVTALVQSSSASTVMIVSFVNAGLLSLVESIGVIMGANIGTTITAWLISILGFKVKISALALPIIAIGFPMMFSSRTVFKSWAQVFIGFALLFMGLDALKHAVPDLKSNPEILAFLSNYADMGYFSTLIFIGVGTILTLVVQSSSAAMALTLVMCFEGWIPFELAAAMVLGENIGTTITANLAALVGNVHAKRAAGAHFVFNIFGVLWMILAFPFFLQGIGWFMNTYMGMHPFSEDALYNSEHIPIALSIFHSTFNILNVILLIGFVPFIAKTVERLIKSKGDDEDFTLEFIGRGLVQTPEISLAEAENEVAKFAALNVKGVAKISDLIDEKESKVQKKLIDKIKDYEDHSDVIELKVAEFLMKLSKSQLSGDASKRIQSLLSVVNHMESIADIYYQMSKSVERKIEKKIWFEENHREDLRSMRGLIDESMSIMIGDINKIPSEISLDKAIELEQKINLKRNKLRTKNFKNIEKGEVNLETGLIFMDLVSGYEKIADNVIHISQALRGDYLDLEDE
jgi:phosphate:Na+ symporter